MVAITLADVDGTIPGVAMLVSVDLSLGEEAQPMHTVVVEEPGKADPELRARRLWEGIKDDWPGHTMTVMCNPRAAYLMANRRTADMIGSPAWDSPAEYLAEMLQDSRH